MRFVVHFIGFTALVYVLMLIMASPSVWSSKNPPISFEVNAAMPAACDSGAPQMFSYFGSFVILAIGMMILLHIFLVYKDTEDQETVGEVPQIDTRTHTNNRNAHSTDTVTFRTLNSRRRTH